MVVIPMFPELREQFGVDSSTISWSFSVYLFPMAALLIVSGTIGERFGRGRVLKLSLVVYALATLACSLAPTLPWFLAARAFQGAANAFVTPLLVAGIADITPSPELGRRIGMYGSFQAVGGGLAPFMGGLAADSDWRYAFWATLAVTVIVAVFSPRGAPARKTESPAIRPLASLKFLALGVAALTAAAGPIGAAVLVGFKARDLLEMEPRTAGLLLASGSAGAALLGPTFGRSIDSFGARRCGIVATSCGSVVVALLAVAQTPLTLTVTFAAAGALFGYIVAVLQQIGATIVVDNRGGAVSAMLSFRFAGHATGPLIWVPLFEISQRNAFVGSALLGLITMSALVVAAGGKESDTRNSSDVSA